MTRCRHMAVNDDASAQAGCQQEAIADMRECRPAPVDHAGAITESLQRENDRRERHRLAVEAGEICECPVEGGCALCGGGEA